MEKMNHNNRELKETEARVKFWNALTELIQTVVQLVKEYKPNARS